MVSPTMHYDSCVTDALTVHLMLSTVHATMNQCPNASSIVRNPELCVAAAGYFPSGCLGSSRTSSSVQPKLSMYLEATPCLYTSLQDSGTFVSKLPCGTHRIQSQLNLIMMQWTKHVIDFSPRTRRLSEPYCFSTVQQLYGLCNRPSYSNVSTKA